MNKLYTLVTGGSAGIGKALAMECAKRGHNILIVALPEKGLDHTAEEIAAAYPVEVHTLGMDLSEMEAPEVVYRWCEDNGYMVNFLINNAGAVGTAEFAASSPSYIDLRIMVNIRALVLLTRYFLPMLMRQKQAYILNMGSLSAYFAIPNKAVYSASKSFVLQFTKALQTELRDTSVCVSIVCPNAVITNPENRRRIKTHASFIAKKSIIDVNDLAARAIRHALARKPLYIPKIINTLFLIVHKLLPHRLEQKILYNEFSKELNGTISKPAPTFNANGATPLTNGATSFTNGKASLAGVTEKKQR